ncbi:MAG TPA: hypothetical protein VGH27_29325 [Streptosporangiaceae bacterium]
MHIDTVPFRRIRRVAALAILLAGLTAQTTTASAAELPRTQAPASAATRSDQTRPHQANATRPRIRSVRGFGLTGRPDVRHPAAGGAAVTRAGRAAAVRAALAGTKVADTCSGSIQPDTVYPCTTPSSGGTDTFTLSLTSTSDLLLIRVLSTGGYPLPIALTAPGGGPVSCQQSSYDQIEQCPTDQAGSYTLQVQNQDTSYTLAYRPLLSDSSCTAANPSFAAPQLTASIAAGGVGSCYTLTMTAGQILHANSTALNQDLLVTVFDSTGTQICYDSQGDCTLTGTGPYFVQADATYANAITYHLELNNISQPQGCLRGAQLTYGSAPKASSDNRCRTLTVKTAGQYQIYAVSPQDGVPTSTVYTPAGTVACTSTYSSTAAPCQLATGTYNLVVDTYPAYRAQVGAVFIAADESRGCQATGDSDFSSGPATGTFTGVGEEICLTLPASVGPAVYLLNQPTANGTSPQLEVVDATGTQVCQSSGFVYDTCAPTGTAPFRIILSGQSAGGGYQVLTQASDSTAGCKLWPQSGFGGSWGATVKLTDVADAACLRIPADQHSTGEMIDYSNLTNTVDAALYVNDPSGNNVCLGLSTAICSYSPGVTYTALLISATGQSDTYHLVRRDVSSTAHCSAPASTVPGGPSTALELTSALDTQCLRVTDPAADKLSFDIRPVSPNSAGAIMAVTGASGAVVCGQYEVICDATGSTSYQIVVSASGYEGTAITAHVDAWLVHTASGWTPQCRAHQLSGATGWAPIRVKMSESAVGYCAVLSVQTNQQTSIYSPSSTDTGSDQPYMMLDSVAGWSSDQIICSGGPVYVACSTGPNTPSGKYALLFYPFEMSLPRVLQFQGVCTYGCPGGSADPIITSVTPASGPTGSLNKVVVGGTDLNLGVQVELASDANVITTATPVSLNANGTALTVRFNTHRVAPGTYDVVQEGVGYTVGVPSPGYLPGAYQVTADGAR